MKTHMTTEREEYISKLNNQIQVIERILKMDSGTVITSELKKRLNSLKNEAGTALKKLKNDEFEIAVVGLEKAGKSTFANALMENNLLPTKDLRCTFTSTQIEYSGDNGDDSAVVSFYSTEEFDRDFKDKLCKLGFPNYERYSFDTVDENNYLKIYDQDVTEDKKKAYGDSIHEDILAIIRNEASLSGLLGCPDVQFAADRIGSGELTAYITDEAKARAVKQVIIRSKKLSEMKNAVIFDVPGFNSPTELHKIQTRERMKSADAIIVVANGMYPSLTGESLKILRESDDDGNPLSDKLFVFANKTEGARDIAQNISDTYNEWTSKGFVSSSNKHRIIFGSALAHLQSAGLDGDDRTLRDFKEREDQMPNGDGIEAMRQQLAKYNHTERFEVLKRRINRINSDISKAFSDILGNRNDVTSSGSYSAEQVTYILGFEKDTCSLIEEKLLDLRDNINSRMDLKQPFSELPLSAKILEYISSEITVAKYGISDEMIDEVRKRTKYTGTFADVMRMDQDIRSMKFDEMYEDFSQNIVNIADKLHSEYSEQIIGIMLEVMGVDSVSPYYDDLNELLKNEISYYRSDLLSSDCGNRFYYQSLIERFSRDIYEVLILSLYNSERLRKFYDCIDNFYSLSVFYKKSDCSDDFSYIDTAPKDQPLCMMLLFHHYINAVDSLRILSDDLCRIAGIKEIPKDVWKYAEKAFFVDCGRKDGIIESIKKAFAKISDMTTDDFKINLLRNKLNEIIEINEPCSATDKESFIDYYKRYHSSVRGGKQYSVDDFRADFDADIQILQDILANAFVRAVSLEKPFATRESKSIDDIIKYIKSKRFGEFISSNFRKIKYKEAAQFDKQRREQEQNAAIIGEIGNILDALAD
ncbi:MAG: dynamin family protein [Prevotella sp.]|nr:dynamin family protein [Prevotella sp.]